MPGQLYNASLKKMLNDHLMNVKKSLWPKSFDFFFVLGENGECV